MRLPLVVRVPEPVDATSAVPSAPIPPAGADSASSSADPETPATETDPFGPWPVSVPADSAATLLDAFLSSRPSEIEAAQSKPISALRALPPADLGAVETGPWVPAKANPLHPEKLFEAAADQPASRH